MLNNAKSPHLAAFIIILLGIVFSAFYATIVPFGEKPDEPSHMARVAFLAESGVEPKRFDTSAFPGIVMYERIQPPLYYRLSAYLMRCFPRINWTISPDQRFGCVEKGRRFVLEASHDPPLQVLGLRCLGILLVAVSGLCVYITASRFFSTAAYALSALILFMMTPQILFIGSSVSNDALAMFSGTLIIMFLTLRSTDNAFIFGLAAAIIAFAGIGVKDNLAAYVFGIPVFLISWRSRKFFPSFLGFLIGIGTVFVVFWLSGRLSLQEMIDAWNWRLFHRSVNLLNLVLKDYPVAIGSLIRSYWAQFGWMDIKPPVEILAFWYLLILISSVGCIIGPARTRLRIVPLLVVTGLAILGWLLSLGSYSQIQGRFLFPYASAISLVLVHGLTGLRIGKWWFVFGIFFIVINIACILHLQMFYNSNNWPEDLELDVHQCYADRIVMNPLSDGFEIGQTFQCKKAGLNSIDIVFEGTHRGGGMVEMTLIEEKSNRVIRTSRLHTDSFSLGKYTRFSFEPVMKSANRLFSFRVYLVDSSETGDLSLRYALGDLYPEGERLENGLVRDGDIKFVTWCVTIRS